MQSWLPILFVIFAIAMAVGPVMLMQPTAQQRRLASVRARAAKAGLSVGSTVWPEKLQQKPIGIMRYTKPWKRSTPSLPYTLLFRKNYPHDMHVAGIWEAHPSGKNLPPWLGEFLSSETIPPSVKALGVAPEGAFIDWDELKEAELEAIISLLQTMVDS
ncbi:hypothetical protein [Halioxenophilus sp. WMMB6]|uniref:hypothetical protein n=1 Tax=Halioxenophilus sp. WMMB6 TaxID=3073815 RepID=UPI00295F5652|nr:hypothetical protein [Halioxenophilus sp. WMMB6]